MKKIFLFAALLNFSSSVFAKNFIYCSEGSPSSFNPQLVTDGTSINATYGTVYNRLVEFDTPAHAKGLGTLGWLGEDTDPIHGLAILEGKTPDLSLLDVRLPPDMKDLTRSILQQFERDHPPPRATK